MHKWSGYQYRKLGLNPSGDLKTVLQYSSELSHLWSDIVVLFCFVCPNSSNLSLLWKILPLQFSALPCTGPCMWQEKAIRQGAAGICNRNTKVYTGPARAKRIRAGPWRGQLHIYNLFPKDFSHKCLIRIYSTQIIKFTVMQRLIRHGFFIQWANSLAKEGMGRQCYFNSKMSSFPPSTP